MEIPWITDSTVYEFRLYAASRLDVPLDSVKARRDIEAAPAALREIADEATRGNIDVMELFIDSSHTVKIGGDVNYLFLEVLPRLKAGVIVHIHDISLPFDYPRDWVINKLRFWTEQYLLRTFLTFNTDFEVLMSNSYLNHYHKHEIKATFPSLPWPAGGSFWMRRKPTVD